MLIRNIKSFQELDNAKKLQAEYLQLMIDNEKVQEERMANYQNPNKPPPVPPQYKTASEIQRDVLGQEKTAIENLTSLGIDFPTASSIAQNLQQKADGVANLIKLNRNFPFIKKDITERFNPKLLDAQVILAYLNELFYELDETIGLKLSSQKTEDYFQRDATGVKGVLPSSEMIDGLLQDVNTAIIPLNLEEGSTDSLVYQLKFLIDNLPTEDEISKIDTYPTLEKNRMFKAIERLVKKHNIPTVAFINDRQGLIEQYNGEMNRAETKEISEVNQGIPTEETKGESDAVQEKLITELSILKNTLGQMNRLSEEKLQELRALIDASDYNIRRKEVGLELGDIAAEKALPSKVDFEEELIKPISKPDAGPIATPKPSNKKQYSMPNDFDKYINMKLGAVKSGQRLKERLMKTQEYYPNSFMLAGDEFVDGGPSFDDSVVYEGYKTGRKKTVYTMPFVLAAGYEGGRKPVDWEELDEKLSPGIHFHLKKNILIEDANYANRATVSVERYSDAQLRDLIKLGEIYYLKKEYIPENPDYDPINNPADRKDVQMGFGLTDKVVKHFKKDNKEMKKLAKSFKNHLKVEEYADSSETETSDEEEKPKKAKGGFKATRIKIGKGVDHDEGPKFKTFGKYIIHMSHLNNDNVLNLKYPSGGGIPSIKPVQIEDNFKEFINDVLDTGKMNDRHFKSLTKNEQNHFIKISQSAKILHKLGLKTPDDDDNQKDVARFELLKGEYDAGNNNEKMIKELRGLVIKFMKGGKINKKSGMDFLMELSIA